MRVLTNEQIEEQMRWGFEHNVPPELVVWKLKEMGCTEEDMQAYAEEREQ